MHALLLILAAKTLISGRQKEDRWSYHHHHAWGEVKLINRNNGRKNDMVSCAIINLPESSAEDPFKSP